MKDNYMSVNGIKGVDEYDMINNACVYDFNNSIRASKFPMTVNPDNVNDEIVSTTYSLASAAVGTGHNNFLSGIVVSFDLTMTNKMCVEWQRYHHQQIVSSQSTMHKISKMNIDKAYISYVDNRIIDVMKEMIREYNDNKSEELYLKILYSNPSGMLLTQRITTNYLQLKTMYFQRKNHPLPEWRIFCKWIESLPHSELITNNSNNSNV